MSRLVVGVIGHVDHGKTALVRSLTGTDTDRLEEEKRRGISIALGFAHLTAGGSEIDLIDMPGHERFVHTMVAGATGIDAVLVVVAANDGVKPQTVEHVAIAGLLGIRRAVVAVSKCDLVGAEEAALVAAEAAALVTENGLAPLPFRGGAGGGACPSDAEPSRSDRPHPNPSPEGEGLFAPGAILTSAHTGAGLGQLAQALAVLAVDTPPRQTEGIAFFPIDRAFVMTGHGPVVTGTLRGARVRLHDTLDLLPAGKPVRVRAVQVHGSTVAAAEPGQRVALNVRGVAIADLARGMALAEPGSLAPSPWLTLALTATGDAPPLRNGARLQALLGTSEVEARLRLLDRDVLEAGGHGFAQLNCAEPVALPAGEHVILRLASPARTVAGGRLIDPLSKRLRRHDAAVLRRLEDLRDLPMPERVAAEVARATPGALTVAGLARLCAVPPARIEALLSALPVTISKRGAVLRRADLKALGKRLPAMLAGSSLGLSRKQLAAALPGTKAVLLDEALAMLTAEDAIARRGGQYVVPNPDEDRALAQGEAHLAQALAATLRQAGLTPPNPSALIADPRTRHAADRLLRDGTIVRCVDAAKNREMLFHREAIAEARDRLSPVLGGDGLLVTEIAAALGISRKFVMPLLAHLDTIRFTQRVGDRRILRRHTGETLLDREAGDHRAERKETAA